MKSTKERIIVMLIEDNQADQKLTIRAFNKMNFQPTIITAQDGQEAMEMLTNQIEDTVNIPRPDIILLDINMPRMDGKQFLKVLRTTKGLNDIPTIILTTSEQEKDIDDAYKLGANAYIKKPASIRDFIEVISKFEQFWFNLAILPSKKKYYSDIRKNS